MKLKHTLLIALGAALSAAVILSVTARRLHELEELNADLRTDLMFAELDACDCEQLGTTHADPHFVFRSGAAVPQGPYGDPHDAQDAAEELARQWPGTTIHLLASVGNVMTSDEPTWDHP